MVDLCTKRQKYCDDLNKVIGQVKNNRRKDDDNTMCLQFHLMLLLRKTTFELLKAIRGWQKGFTKLRRPKLMEKDYMIGMVEDVDFVNTIPFRKNFNFMLGRANIFLLPIQAVGRGIEAVECSPKLAKLVEQFANPDEASLQDGYQALLNSLPPEHYEKVVQAERWVEAPWKPNLTFVEKESDPVLIKLEQERRMAEEAALEAAEAEDRRAEAEAEAKAKEKKERTGEEKESGAQGKGLKKNQKKGDEPKKKRPPRQLTLEEKQQQRADEEVTKMVEELMAGSRRRTPVERVPAPTEKASKYSFNTGSLRSMVEVADERFKEEQARAGAAAAAAKKLQMR